jgi:beta-barrel assembly-enhancing protease
VSLPLAWILGAAVLLSQKNSDVDNIGVRNINEGDVNVIPIEKEVGMGRQMAAEIERRSRMVSDSVITEYINRVGLSLVSNSDAQLLPFTIRVIDSDDPVAVALEGGFLFVNIGLIRAAGDESELAAAMAHEIAHVAARHATEQFSIDFRATNAGAYSPEMEEEADYLGVQYLYKSGRNPNAMARLYRKQRVAPERTGKVEQTIESLLRPALRYVDDITEFNRIKTLLSR